MIEFAVSLFAGCVMGVSSVIYVRNITEGMEFNKRMRVLLFVGLPLGVITGVLAQLIGGWIAS